MKFDPFSLNSLMVGECEKMSVLVYLLFGFASDVTDENKKNPEFFKLMNEIENEDLVFTLETIVDKFGKK